MKKTTNYGLTLYEKEDKMNITSEENSLNANMKIIDSKLKECNDKIPTKASQLENDKKYADEDYVKNKIAEAQLEGGEVDLSVLAENVKNEMLKPVVGYNIYDATKAVEGPSNQYKVGTVILPENDEEYYVVISSDGTSMGTYIGTNTAGWGVYDENGNRIEGATIGDLIRSSDATRSGRMVTIPAGVDAATMTFTYRIASSSGPLCSNVMVTIGKTVPNAYEPYKETITIEGLNYTTPEYVEENYVSKNVYYVSTTGSDENDGLTKETPLATLMKAIKLGATKIGMEIGEYYHEYSFKISDLKDLHIFAYRTDENYNHSEPKRKKAIISGAKYYTGYTKNSDGVYQQANVSEGFNYRNVFINKTTEPTVTNRTYDANLMVIHDDISKDYYLRPVLSYDECVSTADTFYWDGSTLSFNTTSTDFTKVAVIMRDYLITISNCENVVLEDISFNYSRLSNLTIKNCGNFTLNNCESIASATNMGFAIENANGTFNNCYTTKNGYDGFNFHGYGTTIMNDCVAENNYDDGCSHHYGCIGTINGGRFSGSGKAGIAPAYGANVNIYNVYAENNSVGIGYLTTSNGHASMKGMINGCVFINNKIGLQVDSLASVVAINCKYSGNTTEKSVSGTLEEY